MTRTRKAWSLLLSLCMAIMLMPIAATPTAAFAASMDVGTETELVNALDQAQDGDTITLSNDIEVNQQLVINADITLDLGGYTLTNNYENVSGTGIDRFTLITKADVTIQNGAYEVTAPAETGGVETRGIVASEGNLTLSDVTATADGVNVCTYSERGTLTILDSGISGSYAVGSFANNNTVIIGGSTLVGSVCGLYHNGSYYGFECYVSDTTIIGASSDAGTSTDDDADGVYISGSTDTEAAAGCHTAIFTDCTISGATGIEVKYTNLTLSNCTVTATGTTPTFEQYNNGSTTSGFAIVSTDNTLSGTDPQPSGTITINSGTYTGLVGLTEIIDLEQYPDFKEATYVISGGNFTTQIPASYCAEGFMPTTTKNEEGYYTVEPITYTWSVPISLTVDKLGSAEAPAQAFGLVLLGSDGETDIVEEYGLTVIDATIDTDGTGSYTGTLQFSGDEDARLMLSDGFMVELASGSEAGWTYGNEAYSVIVEFDATSYEQTDCRIYAADDEYWETKLDTASFTCSYTGWTLSFETNGGNALDSVTAADSTAIDLSAYVPTRDGYTFAGWYTDSDLTIQATSVTLTADATVYAAWTQNADESGDSTTDDSTSSTDESTLAKTGDETPWAPLGALALLAGCVLAGAAIARKRLLSK